MTDAVGNFKAGLDVLRWVSESPTRTAHLTHEASVALLAERDEIRSLVRQARDYFERNPPIGGNSDWMQTAAEVLK